MSKWSKQTYEMVAEIIAGQIKHAKSEYVPMESEGQIVASREIAAALAVQFANDNPLFDSQRFLIACGCGARQ